MWGVSHGRVESGQASDRKWFLIIGSDAGCHQADPCYPGQLEGPREADSDRVMSLTVGG